MTPVAARPTGRPRTSAPHHRRHLQRPRPVLDGLHRKPVRPQRAPRAPFPEPDAQLPSPSPHEISRRLLARSEFQPATTLNLLAAAWIQFEVHDWFSHGDVDDTWDIALDPDDDWPQRPTRIKTTPDPSPDPAGPLTFVTRDTHWWDASQIYGGTLDFANRLGTGQQGMLRLCCAWSGESSNRRLLSTK